MITFAQGWQGAIGGWAIVLLIIAGIVAVALIAMRAIGVQPPSWVVQILWVLLIVCVGVVAIKFLMSL